MSLRGYGLLAAGRHKPHGLLVRPDRGDLNLLDQLCLVLVFFLSPKKPINRLHKLRGQSQAPPPHRRNRLKIGLHFQATPRKREKKQEPGKASTAKPPAVEKTADEMLEEELRKNNAQSSTDRSAEVDLEQLFIDAHQATGAELLQQSGMAESTETFDTSDPLTPFLAYVLFVLHYRNNPFADSWLIFKHSEMREIRDRKRAVLAHCRPWSTISHSEIDDVCLELLSLFEETPKPESMNSGVFRTFAKALISAKLRVANHFKPGAKSYEVPGCNSKLYFFEVQSFPGPEPPGQAHIAWAHCSDVPGSNGILASGRVIRTAAWTLGLRPDQESMSFFGRCHTNIGWTDSFIEWAANLYKLEHKKQLRHRVWRVHGRKFC